MVKSVSRGTARQTREAPKKPVVQRAGQASLQSPSLKSQPPQNFSPVQPQATPNFSTSANMSPVNPLEGSKPLGGSTNGSQGLLSPLGQKVADFAKSAGQGLARVSTPAVLSRLAQGAQDTGGFTPERLGQGTSPLGDAFSINTPEQQQQTQDALKSLGALSSAASFGSAATGIARSIATKTAVNDIVEQSIASGFREGNFLYQTNPTTGEVIGRVAVNTKTTELATGLVTKTIGQKWASKGLAKAAIGIATLGLGVNGYAEWGNVDNAKTPIVILNDNVLKKNDPEIINEYKNLRSEVLKEDIPAIGRLLIPFYGLKSLHKVEKVLAFEAKVYDAIDEDHISALQNFSAVNGKLPASGSYDPNVQIEATKQRQQIIEESNKRMNEDFNKQRLEYDRLAREADIAARNEDAAFWRKEKERSYAREKQAQQEQADFWAAYRKQVAKMNEDNAPSALSFGLLHS